MKKEIEFDFAKWGQEGISVEINGAKIATLHKHTLIPDAYYGIFDSSSFNTFCLYGNNFKMFEEVKPREFWVNITNKDNIYIYNDFASADAQCGDWTVETIKVREVIE